jgi:hypothetical protein
MILKIFISSIYSADSNFAHLNFVVEEERSSELLHIKVPINYFEVIDKSIKVKQHKKKDLIDIIIYFIKVTKKVKLYYVKLYFKDNKLIDIDKTFNLQ